MPERKVVGKGADRGQDSIPCLLSQTSQAVVLTYRNLQNAALDRCVGGIIQMDKADKNRYWHVNSRVVHNSVAIWGITS